MAMMLLLMCVVQPDRGICVPVGLFLSTSSSGVLLLAGIILSQDQPHPLPLLFCSHYHDFLKSQGGWGVWMGLCRPPCHTRQVPSRLPPASILLLYHRYHHHSLFWPLSRFQRSPLRSTVLYGKHKKEQICETRHSVLISWVALSSFIVCSSVRRGDISFSFPPLKAFTIYLHCVMMF